VKVDFKNESYKLFFQEDALIEQKIRLSQAKGLAVGDKD